MKNILKPTLFLFMISVGTCFAQQEIPLYPDQIPNFKESPDEEEISEDGEVVRKVSRPTLTVFLPLKQEANGSAVIICPGGGYHALMAKREGSEVAKAFNKRGVAAFVLKYRLPDEKFQLDPSLAPLQDAQQALKMVRENSDQWDIDPNRIGVMGFSAGGHLAAMSGTQFGSSAIENPEGVDLRPDFMILVYPVISFTDSASHVGSRNQLLGQSPSKEKLLLYSSELQVTQNTPPAFITHGTDDTVVPVSNSINFYQALQKQDVSAELHVYAKGEHGYLKNPVFEEWFGRVENWMQSRGLMD